MALGPGPHDDLLTAALDAAARRAGDDGWSHQGIVTPLDGNARIKGGVLIIFGAPGSSAFCCQCTPMLLARLPELLRHMADDIERDRKGGA
jgi:hypothetical protein